MGGPPPSRPQVSLEAVLGRPELDVVDEELAGYVQGAVVLVTGAGGSVGAALCARLAGLGARRLVLLDAAEAALVELAATLRYEHAFTQTALVLADIRSAARLAAVFVEHRADVVFHAAAYKHVPLLEAHPVEGVATNVLGTKRVVDAARSAGVERLILLSSDKAVRPTCILGRTKAVAEWIVAAADAPCYGSVRLVNVVDSAGSILPLFRRQLALGQPVTVTHEEATRYLMTIGEAAGLAITAGGLADGEGVFWLDTGPPVPILQLARHLAGGSEVELVGLRPGDRLHERPFHSPAAVDTTPCGGILREPARRVDGAWLDEWLSVLSADVERASAGGTRRTLAALHREAAEAVVPG